MSQSFRKSSSAVTQQAVKFFETLLHASTDGIVITDATQNILVVNDAFCTFFGRHWREVTETSLRTWLGHTDPGAPQRWTELEQRVRCAGECRDAEFQITMNGDVRHLSVNASLLERMAGEEGGVIISTWRDITERKCAEEALRMKDSALAASINAIAITDRHANLTYMNRSFLDMWGYDHQHEVLGKPATAFWQVEEEAAQVVQALRTNRGWIGELRARRKDGSLFSVQVSASMVSDDAGELTYMLASFVDISERKQAEEERERLLDDMGERIKELRCMYRVAESVRKRKTLEEVFRDVVALIPPAWRYPEITRARIRFGGEEYVSKGLEETGWRQSSDILVGGEARGLVEVFHLEPRPELDEGPFLKEERNLIDGIAQTLSEVIERKQAEQALRESEEKHRVIAQAAQDAIIVADATGAIRFWNPAAEMIFGYSAEEIVGRDMIDTIVPPQYHQAKRKGFTEFVKTGRGAAIGKTLELTALRKDGTEFPIEISVSAYRDSEGFRAVAVVRDVTERKNAEERLRESNTVMVRALEREKRISASLEATMEQLERARQATEAATRSKSEFLANMSHEIRTPMTAILGFADVLLERGNLDDAPPERVEAAEAIRRNGEYLLGLLNDILDLSKIEAGKMTVERVDCSLCRTIAEVASLARVRADAKGLAFNIKYLGAVPEIIQSDPTRLRQILINLIGNAIKFSEVGSVQLVTRFVGDGPEPLIQFDLVDTGIGMTAQQVAGLFQPFTQADASTTRKYGGTGLGLTISQRLAELLGGEITVIETAAGAGTRMRVSVPTGSLDGVKMIEDPMAATVVTPTAAGDAARTDERPLAACHILLAEDGPDNQRLIVHMLKKAGAQVTVVENGSLVVDVALGARNDARPFDVILMDMQMPVIDGYRATRLLRQKGYTAPIVALTAHAMASDREKCIQAGCNDYNAKPINRKKLIETIRKHLPAAVVS